MQKQTKAGFTLIELLVVVLIIGILAAIAVPQYQKAVDKSRYATMMPYVKALSNAQKVYYLANGQYGKWSALDIGFPDDVSSDKNYATIGLMKFETKTSGTAIGFYNDKDGNRIAAYIIYSPEDTNVVISGVPVAGKTICLSYGEYRNRGGQICKSMGGKLIAENSGACGSGGCDAYQL